MICHGPVGKDGAFTIVPAPNIRIVNGNVILTGSCGLKSSDKISCSAG